MCFKKKLKDIKPNLNITSKEIVVYQPFRKNRIYFGQKVFTPRNFAFVIMANGKALDSLSEKIILGLKDIPLAVQELKLYKVDKKGRPAKYFEGDTYFVNLNSFDKFTWQTSGTIELEDKHFGAYKVSANGTTDFKVIDTRKLLNFLLTQMGIISSLEARRIISSYINERITRILDKTNPTAKELYLKGAAIMKLIYEKLNEWLNEIGIDLLNINIVDIKFPTEVLDELKKLSDKPSTVGGWGKMSFKEWQASNPNTPPTEKKPKFVTIIPTGQQGHFFKESMAPYFFDNDETGIENVPSVQTAKIEINPIWKGADEIATEINSTKLVNLNDDDSDTNQ